MNKNRLNMSGTFLGNINGTGFAFDRIKTLGGITPGVVLGGR